jgi:hypothetical protein
MYGIRHAFITYIQHYRYKTQQVMVCDYNIQQPKNQPIRINCLVDTLELIALVYTYMNLLE